MSINMQLYHRMKVLEKRLEQAQEQKPVPAAQEVTEVSSQSELKQAYGGQTVYKDPFTNMYLLVSTGAGVYDVWSIGRNGKWHKMQTQEHDYILESQGKTLQVVC